MNNFVFNPKTKIFFGKETELSVGEASVEFGKKVLLHYGGGSIKRSGLYDRVVASLKEVGIEIVELGGVAPNPRLSLVREGIEICRKEKVDLILAVGGGSVIDSAKAISFGVDADDETYWDRYFVRMEPVGTALPIGTVLTIPAAGSEASPHTVITDDANARKLHAHGDAILPVFSILNPELTKTLPDYQTACGAVDMMSHIMERYFTSAEHVDFSDHLCEGAMRSIMDNAQKVLAEPQNYDYRSELMLAGMIAHNDILGLGRTGDWMTHDMEHELSAIWDITHGEGLAILFPAWITYVYPHHLPRFVRFAEKVFDISTGTDEEKVLAAVAALEQWYRSLGMKTSLSELDCFEEALIPRMAASCIPAEARGEILALSKEDVEKIYRAAI